MHSAPRKDLKTMRVGLLAGSGSLPGQILASLRHQGHDVVTIMLGDAQPVLPNASICPLDRPGRIFKILRTHEVTKIIMIGRLERPVVSHLRPDLTGWRILPKIIRGLRQGDDGLLRSIAAIFEAEGFEVLNPLSFLSGLSLAAGTIGTPSNGDLEDVARGLAMLDDLSAHDVGQACIVRHGNIIAIEAAEGTDGMLERAAGLSHGRSGRQKQPSGVLVKMPKKNQDMRFDVPTIGPRTMELAAAAGLSGICVGSNGFMLAEPDESKAALTAHDLFLMVKEL